MSRGYQDRARREAARLSADIFPTELVSEISSQVYTSRCFWFPQAENSPKANGAGRMFIRKENPSDQISKSNIAYQVSLSTFEKMHQHHPGGIMLLVTDADGKDFTHRSTRELALQAHENFMYEQKHGKKRVRKQRQRQEHPKVPPSQETAAPVLPTNTTVHLVASIRDNASKEDIKTVLKVLQIDGAGLTAQEALQDAQRNLDALMLVNRHRQAMKTLLEDVLLK